MDASSRRLLFSKDFKRHMEAADVLLTQLSGLEDEVMSCMDLLLRWVVLRMCDANTQCLLKVQEVTKALFTVMAQQVGVSCLFIPTALQSQSRPSFKALH